MSRTLAVMMTLAWALSTPTAADTGWYGFGAFGRTSFDGDGGGAGALSGGDDKDNGAKVGAGFMFTRYFGVEAGWVDFGKATRGGAVPGLSSGREGEVRANGPFVTGVASIRMGRRFSAFGKLGVIDARLSASDSDSGMTAMLDGTADWRPLVGVGAAYRISEAWAIQTEYGKFNKIGDKDRPGDVRVDMISVGMVFRLG